MSAETSLLRTAYTASFFTGGALADATDGHDLDLVLAGLLHDTIEDTETTFDEIVSEFGTVVANLCCRARGLS